jgi:hypothetical protein
MTNFVLSTNKYNNVNHFKLKYFSGTFGVNLIKHALKLSVIFYCYFSGTETVVGDEVPTL